MPLVSPVDKMEIGPDLACSSLHRFHTEIRIRIGEQIRSKKLWAETIWGWIHQEMASFSREQWVPTSFRRKINSTVINHRGRHRFPIQIYNYNVPRKSYFPTLSRRATSCSFLSPGLHEISWPGTTYAGLNPSPPITVTRLAPTRNTRALSRCTFRSRSEACRRARVQNVSDNNYTHEQVDSKS